MSIVNSNIVVYFTYSGMKWRFAAFQSQIGFPRITSFYAIS